MLNYILLAYFLGIGLVAVEQLLEAGSIAVLQEGRAVAEETGPRRPTPAVARVL